MRKDTKELVELTEKWNEKITEIAIKYEKAIGKLKEARDSFEDAKKGFWGILISLSPLIVAFLLIGFAFYFINAAPCGSIGYGEFKIIKECQQK